MSSKSVSLEPSKSLPLFSYGVRLEFNLSIKRPDSQWVSVSKGLSQFLLNLLVLDISS
jgi:hypothetical protein